MDPGRSSPNKKQKGSVIGDKWPRKKTAEVGLSATRKSTCKGEHKQGTEKNPMNPQQTWAQNEQKNTVSEQKMSIDLLTN